MLVRVSSFFKALKSGGILLFVTFAIVKKISSDVILEKKKIMYLRLLLHDKNIDDQGNPCPNQYYTCAHCLISEDVDKINFFVMFPDWISSLKSSFRKFYGRYGDLIQQYEVSLSRMLNDILTLDQQWLPNRSDFPPISWPWYGAWPPTNMSGFHGAFATGVACK